MPETIHDFVRADRAALGRRPSKLAQIGVANALTGVRAAASVALLAVACEWMSGALPFDAAHRWATVALALAAFATDGLDGFLARRHGRASAFGARFDLESDALLVLALALLVFASAQAGHFVLLSGAMRYLFVAAGLLWPALRAPLPPSVRRKAICVAQTALLIAALLPPVPPPAGAALAALGLALLLYSFAADCAGRLSAARA
jgi:phosphatidylglycerophosphate synthase